MFNRRDHDNDDDDPFSFADDFHKDDFFKDWEKQKADFDRDFNRSHNVYTMSVSIIVYIIAAAVVFAVLMACCCAKRRRAQGQIISPPPPPPGPNQPAVYPQQQYTPYPTQPTAHPVAVSFPVQSPAPYPPVAQYPAVAPYPAAAPYPAGPYPAGATYPHPQPSAGPTAPDAHTLPPSYEQVMQHEAKQPPYNPHAPR